MSAQTESIGLPASPAAAAAARTAPPDEPRRRFWQRAKPKPATATLNGVEVPRSTLLLLRWSVAIIGVLVLALAVAGAIGSFTTVRNELRPFFPYTEPWIPPLGIDLGILVCLSWDLLQEYMTRKGIIERGLPGLRWVGWLFTAATVYLNAAAAHGNLVGIVAHAAMPGIFVAMLEGFRMTLRRGARLARKVARQQSGQRSAGRLRVRYLLLFGWPAFTLWRSGQEAAMLGELELGVAMRKATEEAARLAATGTAKPAVRLLAAAKLGGRDHSGAKGSPAGPEVRRIGPSGHGARRLAATASAPSAAVEDTGTPRIGEDRKSVV